MTGAELETAGVPIRTLDPARLVLRHEGKVVPLRVFQSQKGGPFTPQDAIEFIGDYPRGDRYFFRANNRYNVYHLTWTEPAPAGARWTEAAAAPLSAAQPLVFLDQQHIEYDDQRFFVSEGQGQTDHFFFFGIRPSPDPMPMFQVLAPGFAADVGRPLQFTWSLFGAVSPRVTTGPAHLYHFRWGEHDLGTHGFDGVREFITSATVPAQLVTSGSLPFRELIVETPPDRLDHVGLVYLDWLNIAYPRRLDASGTHLFSFNGNLLNAQGTSATLPAVVRLDGVQDGSEIFYLQSGKVQVHRGAGPAAVEVRNPEDRFLVVAPAPRLLVDSVESRPGLRVAALDSVASDTRHLIIYHSLMERPARLLAAYRSATGTPSHAVDAQDIQDALNHGFVDDGSQIKSFVRYVYDQAPNLRYLLLFSDSTNNYRDARPLNQLLQPEVMIPIHWVENRMVAWTAGFPDCNYYGALGASPTFPDLAVGRIPANNAAEGMEAVRKIIEHEATPNRAPGKAIFVSSVEQNFQDLVRQAEEMMKTRFTSTSLLFPASQTADQEVTRMTEELSSGADLLYYLGHGGQYVWRVGPTDFQRQKDLFTPKEVRKLRNAGRYPIITCSSCYTTSFDGPEALGEVLVTAARAGAIALIGTTWKSTVYEDHAFNVRLMQALLDVKQNPRLGDAFLKAKRAYPPARPTDVDGHAFTLLGDPAVLTRIPEPQK
jgi:hypothetical protein